MITTSELKARGVDREDNFYTWADQQRREREDASS